MPPAGFMPKQFPAAGSFKSLTGATVSLQFESCHVFRPSLDSSHRCSRFLSRPTTAYCVRHR